MEMTIRMTELHRRFSKENEMTKEHLEECLLLLHDIILNCQPFTDVLLQLVLQVKRGIFRFVISPRKETTDILNIEYSILNSLLFNY